MADKDVQLDALAFGAHPDDVELSCGGTLIKLANQGYKTGVVALTRGELGTRGSQELRQQEFDAASRILGLAAHKMLDIPDGHIAVSQENKLKVIREIRRHQPRIVFAPYWIDRHPDHGNASDLVREAAFLAGLKKIETGQPAFRPSRILYSMGRHEFQPSFVVDISETHEQKMQAVLAYQSQFDNPEKHNYGDEETNISRPEFMDSIVALAKLYGSRVGVAFGEPFLTRGDLRIDDPVGFFGAEYLNAFH